MTGMTPERLAEIRARAEAATEGPWFGSAGGLYIYGATPGDEVARTNRPADATFIAAARTDVPELVAEVEWLTAAFEEEIESLAAEIHEAYTYQYDECDHGTYAGGAMHGEPYSMCRINAERIIRRRSNPPVAATGEGGDRG